MRIAHFQYYKAALFCFIALVTSCKPKTIDHFISVDGLPSIRPDYTSVTVPYNIAPLNFLIEEDADDYQVKISSAKGKPIVISGDKTIQIPEKDWKTLLSENRGKPLFIDIFVKKGGNWKKYKTIENSIADEPIDGYLVYRLIEPLYVNWQKMGIYQRCLENFEEKSVLNNNLTQGECMNCHSFQMNSPQNMLIHLRGKRNGGTLVVSGNKVTKINTKTSGAMSPGVYPAWHPTQNLIAFSVNEIGQLFHARSTEKIEVLDVQSDLVLYDVDKNQITPIIQSNKYFETFPAWSPDGRYLYFCSARCPTDRPKTDKLRGFDISEQYTDLKYNILRIAFDPKSRKFGAVDTVVNALKLNKSASFPRISPDGKFLLFCLSDYGNFSIWHKSSDLYLMNLQIRQLSRLDAVNSNDVESYHTWSSNGRWFVFSSRRIDGSYTRPYFAYFDKNGKAYKPFLLPQEDPLYYQSLYKSYNVPELIKTPVNINIRDFEKQALEPPKPAGYSPVKE
ncbi:MAG: hypothetical protein Q8928_06580 [Bacteroidota bacterium]|nr:hypothetical protein [Bacteroidota bacterium]